MYTFIAICLIVGFLWLLTLTTAGDIVTKNPNGNGIWPSVSMIAGVTVVSAFMIYYAGTYIF